MKDLVYNEHAEVYSKHPIITPSNILFSQGICTPFPTHTPAESEFADTDDYTSLLPLERLLTPIDFKPLIFQTTFLKITISRSSNKCQCPHF